MARQPAANYNKISVETNVLKNHEMTRIVSEPGRWSPRKRRNYNLQDAVSRHSIQVFPKSWSAILLTFDNAGTWNIISDMRERAYQRQELYVSVFSPRKSLEEEYNIPDNAQP
ncbi:hypothetical protein Dsin_018855 [Dipteronia sinensis]|uniref:Plastocyanin-like domain-containing protein n=1 Tax=Dipteronia sinensis TaxID=43782 RepID=A0AAE0E3H1_9ROSI|nr:hypothetical protein Dsin_018855 [Dipteronia sinensis]